MSHPTHARSVPSPAADPLSVMLAHIAAAATSSRVLALLTPAVFRYASSRTQISSPASVSLRATFRVSQHEWCRYPYSSNAGRRVLLAKIRSQLPEIEVE